MASDRLVANVTLRKAIEEWRDENAKVAKAMEEMERTGVLCTEGLVLGGSTRSMGVGEQDFMAHMWRFDPSLSFVLRFGRLQALSRDCVASTRVALS